MVSRQSRFSIQRLHKLDTLKVHLSFVPVIFCALQQHLIVAAFG